MSEFFSSECKVVNVGEELSFGAHSGVYKFVPHIKLEGISEITLLSIEEWEKAREIKSVPKFTGFWRLRSPGYGSSYTCGVLYDGYVSGICSADYTGYGVRPAFKIPNLKSEIGSKIFVENTLCTVIDKDYVLSDTIICMHRFDANSNEYETSEIKAFINSDKFKEML